MDTREVSKHENLSECGRLCNKKSSNFTGKISVSVTSEVSPIQYIATIIKPLYHRQIYCPSRLFKAYEVLFLQRYFSAEAIHKSLFQITRKVELSLSQKGN